MASDICLQWNYILPHLFSSLSFSEYYVRDNLFLNVGCFKVWTVKTLHLKNINNYLLGKCVYCPRTVYYFTFKLFNKHDYSNTPLTIYFLVSICNYAHGVLLLYLLRIWRYGARELGRTVWKCMATVPLKVL
jgi:hypothetical protein